MALRSRWSRLIETPMAGRELPTKNRRCAKCEAAAIEVLVVSCRLVEWIVVGRHIRGVTPKRIIVSGRIGRSAKRIIISGWSGRSAKRIIVSGWSGRCAERIIVSSWCWLGHGGRGRRLIAKQIGGRRILGSHFGRGCRSRWLGIVGEGIRGGISRRRSDQLLRLGRLWAVGIAQHLAFGVLELLVPSLLGPQIPCARNHAGLLSITLNFQTRPALNAL